jgi:hypothetical protein
VARASGRQQQFGTVDQADRGGTRAPQVGVCPVVPLQGGGYVTGLRGEEAEVVLHLSDRGGQFEAGEQGQRLAQVGPGRAQLTPETVQDAAVDQGATQPDRIVQPPEGLHRRPVPGKGLGVAAQAAKDQRALHQGPGQAQPAQRREGGAGAVDLVQRGARPPEIVEDQRVAHPRLRLGDREVVLVRGTDRAAQVGRGGGRVVQGVRRETQRAVRGRLRHPVALPAGPGESGGRDGERAPRIHHDQLQRDIRVHTGTLGRRRAGTGRPTLGGPEGLRHGWLTIRAGQLSAI